MNRQLKFRAWDGDKLFRVTMLYLTQNGLKVGGGGHLQLAAEAVDLMQFTGLKDKNGVEIYEGDILTTPFGNYDPTSSSKAPVVGAVEFHLDHQSYQMRLGSKPTGKAAVALNMGPPFTGFYERRANDSAVIGNIYEHPELLK